MERLDGRERRQAAAGWRRAGLLLASALVLTAVGELLPRLALGGPLTFGYRPMGVLSAVLTTAAFLGIAWAVTNRLVPALALVGGFVALLGAGHVRKMETLGKPLMPWDLLQAKQVVFLFPTVLNDAVSVLVLVAVAASALWALVVTLRKPKAPLPWRVRALLAAGGLAWLVLLAAHHESKLLEKALAKTGLVNTIWDQNENLRRNGLVLATVMNVRSLFVRMPGYSEDAIRSAMQPAKAPVPAPEEPDASEPPDVVVWMLEAMFDPTRLPNVTFSRDPMPNMRRLMEAHTSGTLVAPTYGGGTANAEFEVLTGLTTSFLPEGAFPYQHYVNAPVETLAWAFRSAGYRSLVVHNFHRWYWQREQVYPLLGIERFIAQDELKAPRDGVYPSDEPVVDRVLAELDGEADPAFVYAITMVTHGPYGYELDAPPEVTVEGLEGRSQRELQNYASALLRADRALGRLVEALEKRERPTVLVVFGDHLPALGVNKGLYAEAGYLTGEDPVQDAVNMGTVPLLVWSSEARPVEDLHLSMTTLAPHILRAAGLEPGGWFERLETLAQNAPVLTADLLCDGNGKCGSPDDPPSPEAAMAMQAMQLVSYDRLIGKRYSQPEEPTASAAAQ